MNYSYLQKSWLQLLLVAAATATTVTATTIPGGTYDFVELRDAADVVVPNPPEGNPSDIQVLSATEGFYNLAVFVGDGMGNTIWSDLNTQAATGGASIGGIRTTRKLGIVDFEIPLKAALDNINAYTFSEDLLTLSGTQGTIVLALLEAADPPAAQSLQTPKKKKNWKNGNKKKGKRPAAGKKKNRPANRKNQKNRKNLRGGK